MKKKCSNCGKWYLDHTGQFIVLPQSYDDKMCRKCNYEIDVEIATNK